MINPGISCGRCPACEEGEESLCREFRLVGEHLPGTAAEFVVVPAGNLGAGAGGDAVASGGGLLARHPHRLADAGTTRARLRAGETVLIWGIGGGVALAALQIVRLLGGRAIVTSGTDAKLETARSLGAAAALHQSRDGRRRGRGAAAHRRARRRRGGGQRR